MNISAEETAFFVELAITSLLKVGVISIEEKPESQEVSVLQNAPSTGALQ